MKKYELPTEFREEWLRTLRSGEFKQSRNYLIAETKDGDTGYCCLGIACICLGIPKDTMSKITMIHPERLGIDKFRIPEEISGCTTFSNKLATMNDEGESFTEIADYIEQNTIGV